jgi:hypothetical protein
MSPAEAGTRGFESHPCTQTLSEEVMSETENQEASPRKDLRLVVRERIAAAGPEIEERVIVKMAEEKISVRADKLYGAYTELDNTNREIQKIEKKPDIIHKDLTGKVTHTGYNQETVKKHSDLVQRKAKLEKAINVALEKNDWTELDKVIGGKGKGPAPDDDAAE